MNIEEIRSEIADLERGDTNWSAVQKLSWLYTVYDHMTDDHTPVLARSVVDVMPECGDSEFCKAIAGKGVSDLIKILSEHMNAIQILYPKEYQAVIDMIKEVQ